MKIYSAFEWGKGQVVWLGRVAGKGWLLLLGSVVLLSLETIMQLYVVNLCSSISNRSRGHQSLLLYDWIQAQCKFHLPTWSVRQCVARVRPLREAPSLCISGWASLPPWSCLRMRKWVPRTLHRTACIHDDWEKERECAAQKGKLALQSHFEWRTVSYEGVKNDYFLHEVVWALWRLLWGSVRDITQAERNYAVAMPEQVRLLNRLFHHSSSVYACSDRLVFCLAKYNLP